ncbi:Ltp family lipoprotein [Mycobacterium sp. E802]|uniref:Ltp family lipoprotein n=2 Tax=unclassified Mycobacterium TaxID=2642494 RepID=UPI000A7328C0|nr:Ltp family lipoprotein [Mycobacterium sp. E802]
MITYQVQAAATARVKTKKNRRVAVGLLLAIIGAALWAVSAIAGGLDVAAPSVQLTGAATSIEAHGVPHTHALSGPMIPLEPASTASQRNAVRTAKDYLDYTAFSRQGLIKQLEYEGFSTADATFAVDSITVDWNAQAAKAAKAYLDYSGFSRSGLINQLEYEGYTPAQAAYGATAAGL